MINKSGLGKNLLFTLVIGALAAVINHFRLPLFFEAEFIFGQFLVLLVAVYRGPLMGLVAAIISTIPLVMAWGSLWATLTFGLEALFIGIFCSRNKSNIMLFVIIYWLLIGMPISWISISTFDEFLESHRISILIKQITNAIIYANLAAIFILMPWVRKLFRICGLKQTLSLKEQASHLISTLLTTIGVLFFFYILNQNIEKATEDNFESHDHNHQKLSYEISLFIDENLVSVSELRFLLSQVWDDIERRKQMLLKFNERHSEFSTMVIANKDGFLINSSPADLIDGAIKNGEQLNIMDRDYFINTIDNNHTYVSPGFVGRGFGSDLIAAVSVSIPSPDKADDNIGVVEGSFIFKSMSLVEETMNNISSAVEAVIVDQENKVLMSTDGLALKTLTEFEYAENASPYNYQNLVNINLNDGQFSKESYYITQSEFDWGWKLITLQNEAIFARIVEKSLLFFAIAIVFVVLVSKVLAWAISHSWSYYLQCLNKMIMKGKSFNAEVLEFEENDQLPVEVRNFYQEIKSSRQQILKMNEDLQNTIAERTEKLQKANEKLFVMARHDELTGLENRRVFNDSLNELWIECQRELFPLSMLIIDVDYFKKLNDSFGHPVGDQILSDLGNELLKFKKNGVKSISRLGGEEFCFLIKGSGHKNAKKIAEDIRSQIENMKISVGSGQQIHITISIGVATIDATKYTASRLYQLADNALYEAKSAGRNIIKDLQAT